MSKSARLRVEGLEPRDVPATFTPATTAALISAIEQANQTPEADVITLTRGVKYVLDAVNNYDHGPTGLPVITAAQPITIVGNNATIKRPGTAPDFRLLAVAAGATLTVEHLTLRGGHAYGFEEEAGRGGAIFNQGDLTLRQVTVTDNTAEALISSRPARGGGIYTEGTLTVEGGSIQSNNAQGNRGANEYTSPPLGGHAGDHAHHYRATAGGDGLGGGVYAAGGTVTLSGVNVTANSAAGGVGGKAKKGPNAPDGSGLGGGLYVSAGVLYKADALTAVTGNTASTSDPNVHQA